MTVKELRELLKGVDDDTIIYIGNAEGFESPEAEFSGLSELGPLCDENGIELAEQPKEPEKVFILTSGEGFDIQE